VPFVGVISEKPLLNQVRFISSSGFDSNYFIEGVLSLPDDLALFYLFVSDFTVPWLEKDLTNFCCFLFFSNC
jgi:hypothetical protein